MYGCEHLCIYLYACSDTEMEVHGCILKKAQVHEFVVVHRRVVYNIDNQQCMSQIIRKQKNSHICRTI